MRSLEAFAILLAQDLAIVPLLLVVALLVEQDSADSAAVSWPWAVGGAAVAVIGIVVGGQYGLPRILAIAENQKNEPAFVCVSLLGVLAAALAAESVGLSMALGTFLLGATLSTSPFGHRIAATVGPVKSTLLALFFLSVGLSVDLRIVSLTWAPLLLNAANEIRRCLRVGAGPGRPRGGRATTVARAGAVRRVRVRPVRRGAGGRTDDHRASGAGKRANHDFDAGNTVFGPSR